MSSYYHRAFACPYYTSDAKGVLRCEGGSVRMRRPALLSYAERFCCNPQGWERCTLAQAVTADYNKRPRE